MWRFQFSSLSFECLYPVCHFAFRNRHRSLRKWNIKKSFMVMECDFILIVLARWLLLCYGNRSRRHSTIWHRILTYIYFQRVGHRMFHYHQGFQGLKCIFCYCKVFRTKFNLLAKRLQEELIFHKSLESRAYRGLCIDMQCVKWRTFSLNSVVGRVTLSFSSLY